MALVTNMDVPLGRAIGNAIEVEEAVDTLLGHGPDDLTDICIELSSYMLLLAGAAESLDSCKALAEDSIKSGSAFDKLCAMVAAQGGDISVLKDGFNKADLSSPFKASRDGYITHMDAEAIGLASLALGAGRACLNDVIDYSAGIFLQKKPGDHVTKGDALACLHTSDSNKFAEAKNILTSAYTIGDTPPPAVKTILAAVTKDGVTML
jgi:pyrimidine-nucleoside phosphorylase